MFGHPHALYTTAHLAEALLLCCVMGRLMENTDGRYQDHDDARLEAKKLNFTLAKRPVEIGSSSCGERAFTASACLAGGTTHPRPGMISWNLREQLHGRVSMVTVSWMRRSTIRQAHVLLAGYHEHIWKGSAEVKKFVPLVSWLLV